MEAKLQRDVLFLKVYSIVITMLLGVIAFSAIASQALFIPAAVIMVTDTQSGRLGAGKIAGLALVIVGAPLLSAVSDRFVRILR